MMISPEIFYNDKLKGKTAPQILTVIRGLKQEIGKLKNIIEAPDYICLIHPSATVQIHFLQDYLEAAKKAFCDAGGIYIPSAAEKRAMKFEENICNIERIEFLIGGFLNGYEKRCYIIKNGRVYAESEHIMIPGQRGDQKSRTEYTDKESFFEEIIALRIGEMRKSYTSDRFGIIYCDGTQWELNVYFSNELKPHRIYGDNAYSYNFDRILDFFDCAELSYR